MNRLWLLPCAALLFVLARDTPKARACGGGALFDPHVVGEPRLLEADDFDTRSEARFLYPFLIAQPKQANVLWEYSYNALEQVPAPDVAAFDRAVNAHDYPRAEQEAQAVVDSWYALPPVLAAPHRPVLLRAVEFLESYPFLSKLSLEQARALPDPHRPTQQFLGLLRQSSQNIPNGWARGAKNSVSAGIFTDLLAQTRAWLKANPTHPLRDLVELWQVRLRYFSGDTERISLMKFEVEKSDRQGLYAGRHCGDVHVRDLQVHRRHAQQLPRDPRSRHARRIGRRRVVYGPRRRDLRRELHRDV